MITVGVALFNAKSLMLCGSFVQDAKADSSQKTFLTTASVSPRCSFSTGAISVQFGVYDPTKHVNVDANTIIDIRCTKGAAVTLGVDNGNNYASATRRMKHENQANEYLKYELYSNVGHTTIWNNTNTLNYVSTSAANHQFTVYGRIPSNQNAVKGGNYADTVTITATF